MKSAGFFFWKISTNFRLTKKTAHLPAVSIRTHTFSTCLAFLVRFVFDYMATQFGLVFLGRKGEWKFFTCSPCGAEKRIPLQHYFAVCEWEEECHGTRLCVMHIKWAQDFPAYNNKKCRDVKAGARRHHRRCNHRAAIAKIEIFTLSQFHASLGSERARSPVCSSARSTGGFEFSLLPKLTWYSARQYYYWSLLRL